MSPGVVGFMITFMSALICAAVFATLQMRTSSITPSQPPLPKFCEAPSSTKPVLPTSLPPVASHLACWNSVGRTLPLTVNSSRMLAALVGSYDQERCNQPAASTAVNFGNALLPLLSLTPWVYGPNTPSAPLRPLMSIPNTLLPLSGSPG